MPANIGFGNKDAILNQRINGLTFWSSHEFLFPMPTMQRRRHVPSPL